MLKRAKIQIQGKNSFFAYLSLYLKMREEKSELPKYAGAGVDIKGNFIYKKDFIEGLSGKEVEGVVVHEILHLSLLHILRRGSRDAYISNLCDDIVVNQLIKDNGFTLPNDCVMSDHNNEIEIGGIVIKDCNKKPTEQIYSELEKQAKKVSQALGKDGSGKGLRFDEHIKGDGDKMKKGKGKSSSGGKSLSDGELKELEKLWGDRIQEALAVSEMRGDTPKGIGRLVGELHKEKINWKQLLNQYITQQIPYDHSYAQCHKKSISTGFYMPHMTKEKISISILIDMSGSIGEKELSDFLSEICGIARAYQERITMRIFSHDTEFYDNGLVMNGNIEKIKTMEIKGGGGTSHIKSFEGIKEKDKDCKCCIFLTDGYSDLDEIDFGDYPFGKLFVISEDGDDRQLEGKNCQIIKLGDMN